MKGETIYMKPVGENAYVVDEEEMNRDFPNMEDEIDEEIAKMIKKSVDEGKLDQQLEMICKLYGESVQNFSAQGAYGMVMTKTWYDFAISYAKRKGLDVSEYSTELKHLDDIRERYLK